MTTTDDLQAALDASKGQRMIVDPAPPVVDKPAPKRRAPRPFATANFTFDEGHAKALHEECTRFLTTAGTAAYPAVLGIVVDLERILAPKMKSEEPLHLNDPVYYMSAKGRSGTLVDITGFGEKEYGTVQWDVYTKTPFSVVPLENLRKL